MCFLYFFSSQFFCFCRWKKITRNICNQPQQTFSADRLKSFESIQNAGTFERNMIQCQNSSSHTQFVLIAGFSYLYINNLNHFVLLELKKYQKYTHQKCHLKCRMKEINNKKVLAIRVVRREKENAHGLCCARTPSNCPL